MHSTAAAAGVPPSQSAFADSDLAITTRGATKRYGAQAAVSDLDLAVPRGTIFGFIGPSGAGKTTTIRLLIGSERPSDGEIVVLGGAPTAFSAGERARIGYMPQLSVLFPELSIRENLNFVASIYGMPLRRRAAMREALEFVELHGDRRKRLRDASGGMQRRLALAAALVHQPELLFLDEPTAGVDPVLRRKFWDHFAALRDEGRTLFVTTQYVGEAAYCDVVGVLSEGRLVIADSPDGLRRRAFGGDVLSVKTVARLDDASLRALGELPFVERVERTDDGGDVLRVVVDRADRASPRIADWLDDRGVLVESISEDMVPFDDVFIALLEGGRR
jgi:ABC-2 type transport system ATP-binding protein